MQCQVSSSILQSQPSATVFRYIETSLPYDYATSLIIIHYTPNGRLTMTKKKKSFSFQLLTIIWKFSNKSIIS